MDTAAVPTDALTANPSIADNQAKYLIFCRLVTAGDTLEFAQTPRILLNHSTPSLRVRQPHIHTEIDLRIAVTAPRTLPFHYKIC